VLDLTSIKRAISRAAKLKIPAEKMKNKFLSNVIPKFFFLLFYFHQINQTMKFICNRKNLTYMYQGVRNIASHMSRSASKVRHIDETIKIVDAMYETCKHDAGQQQVIVSNKTLIFEIGSEYESLYSKILSVSDVCFV